MNMYEEFVEISKKLREIEAKVNKNQFDIVTTLDSICARLSKLEEIEKKLEKNEKPPQVVMQVGNNTTLSQEVKPETRWFNISNERASSKVFW